MQTRLRSLEKKSRTSKQKETIKINLSLVWYEDWDYFIALEDKKNKERQKALDRYDSELEVRTVTPRFYPQTRQTFRDVIIEIYSIINQEVRAMLP